MSNLTIILSQEELGELRKQGSASCRNQRQHARWLVLQGLGLVEPETNFKNEETGSVSQAGAGFFRKTTVQ